MVTPNVPSPSVVTIESNRSSDDGERMDQLLQCFILAVVVGYFAGRTTDLMRRR